MIKNLFKKSTVLLCLSFLLFGMQVKAMAPCDSNKKVKYQFLYVDKSSGQAIYSYPKNTQDSEGSQIVYVDEAYGRAIYSYPHNTQDQVVEFNVCYSKNSH